MTDNNSLSHQKFSKDSLFVLAMGALGIVYGDIGTSPLYAFRECFSPSHGLAPTENNILGILSIFFWALAFLISVKYLIFFMRADNRGEGGILALMALVFHDNPRGKKVKMLLFFLGIFGAALLYGDGIITPSISVISAVEGLNVATDIFQPYIVYISILILTILFMFQRKGTAKIGSIFGTVICLWFFAIGILGFISIFKSPRVLAGINPIYGFEMLFHNKQTGFAILGSVFLAFTGAEMLYADMGHFGKNPIRLGWFALVLPALILNYFGQGAHLLAHPDMVENLFYRIAPPWLLYPLVVLATAATVIASQAVISGAFSITRQAIQLGFCPRLHIVHTSSKEIGQVYLPTVNFLLFLGTVTLIIGFQDSSKLAGAYGIAVSGTMFITTLLAVFIAKRFWQIKTCILIPVAFLFVIFDLSFFSSCLLKIKAGGWIPILIAITIYLLMIIWKRNREFIRKKIESESLSVDFFIKDIKTSKPIRVSGTAIFLSGNSTGIPRTLLHNFKHNKVLHETTVLMTLQTEDIPFVSEDKRVEISDLGEGLYRMILKYGFSESADIPKALKKIKLENLNFDPMRTTYFLGRENLIIKPTTPIDKWQKKIFTGMSKFSFDASSFYNIPPGRVIELGLQIEV